MININFDILVQRKWYRSPGISLILALLLGPASAAMLSVSAQEVSLPKFISPDHTSYLLAQNQRRTALVIGNSDYVHARDLKNPGNDATDMAQTLRALGFDVILLQNADRKSTYSAIEQFKQQLRIGGVGLFYFAGHAIQVQGENYLIPVEGNIILGDGDRKKLKVETVPLAEILEAMKDANNPMNLVFLDACRNNPFYREWRSISRGLAPVAARGTLISFATGPGNVADDGNGRNSPFTESLLKHMNTPRLAVELMLKKVRKEVEEKTKGQQSPWEHSNLVGDFSFNPGTKKTPHPVPNTTPLPPATIPSNFGSPQVWKGRATQNRSQNYSMDLYVEKVSGRNFFGKIHWPQLRNSITAIDGEIVSDFGDIVEQSRWKLVPGFDINKSPQCLTFTDTQLIQGSGIYLNGKYYACIQSGAMQGAYFLRPTESTPRKIFKLFLE